MTTKISTASSIKDIRTFHDFEEYRRSLSEADSSQIDEVVEKYCTWKDVVRKPTVTDVEVFGKILDQVYGRQPKDHQEFYPDTRVDDDAGLRKAISRVVDPCYTFGFCRIPRSWWKDLKKAFWTWYFKKFPKKMSINRHNKRVKEVTRLLAGMGDKSNNVITKGMESA